MKKCRYRFQRPIETTFVFTFFILSLSAQMEVAAQETRVPPSHFTDISAPLVGVYFSATAWGDYDNDGDLDIFICGLTAENTRRSEIYRNDAGVFVESGIALLGIDGAAADWGDYDNDGDLDLLLAGTMDTGVPITKIYRNDETVFTDIDAPIAHVHAGAVAWGDYDNDGDLDIALTGISREGLISKIYRNSAGSFEEVSAALMATDAASIHWGDYDNDGDLDLLSTGLDTLSVPVAVIQRNDGGTFVNIGAPLAGVVSGASAWGDYDNDGDLDIALSGAVNFSGDGPRISKIYRNDAGNFEVLADSLIGVSDGSVVWGDYDNDGDLDLLVTGWTPDTVFVAKIYRNDAGSFAELPDELPGASFGAAGAGDYDNDGDLDILITGASDTLGIFSAVYQNNIDRANTAPTTPANLISSPGVTSTNLNSVLLSWDSSTDDETPQAGLTYNLRIGTTPGGSEIISPMADTTTGFRRVPRFGNASHLSHWTLTNLPEGTYYWSVQAIDHNFTGSTFAPEQSFNVIKQALSVYPLVIEFDATNIGTHVDSTLTVTNVGATDLTISSIFTTGGDSTEFSVQSASSFTLTPGQQEFVTVRFQPQALGARSTIMIFLHDGAGEYAAAYLTGAGIDVEVPSISAVSAAANVDLGAAIPLSATVTDNFFIQEVRLYYRQGGQTVFLSTVMNFNGVDYQAVIPGSIAGGRGVEFHVEAVDGGANRSTFGAQTVRVRIPENHLSRNHPGGSGQDAYRLISLPLDSNDPLVTSTLLDDLGAADTLQWRLWDIDPLRSNSLFPYREFPTIDNLAPGKAKFLITSQSRTLTSEPGMSVNSIVPFEISLRPGWNMIASPFNFDIPIENLYPENLRAQLYTYNGAWESAPSLLKPWEGYMIKVDEAMTLRIVPSEGIAAPPAKMSASTSLDWSIRIEARCERAVDRDNVIGVSRDAATEWDELERYEPPPIGEFVMVAFPHRAWQSHADVYTTDFRPPSSNGQVWDFTVDTNIPNKPVSLRFDDLESLPPEFEATLIDATLKLTQNVRQEAQYVYRATRHGGKKFFRLVVGTSTFVAERTAEFATVPATLELAQNFPNPFNPSTSIKIGLPQKSRVSLVVYDLLGREIVTLLDNVEKNAGYAATVWDGKNQNGTPMPSGIYLYRLRAGKNVLTKKMMLIK